jgi:ketosteroid isomerase-like protein
MIVVSCQRKSNATADDIEAIRTIENQWALAIRTKDINKIASIYASDAIEMPPGEPIAAGIEAIKKGWDDKYISIYKKKDGKWKCIISIWNDNKPDKTIIYTRI